MNLADNDPIVARSATSEDLPAVANLAVAARGEAEPQRGGALLLDLWLTDVGDASRYDRHITGADRQIVVGTIGSSVVGYSAAHIQDGATQRVCMIEELYVHPDARQVGVAAAMLAEMKGWALSQRCAWVESQVLPGNRLAKNFFERMGMVTRAMRVSASLEPDGD